MRPDSVFDVFSFGDLIFVFKLASTNNVVRAFSRPDVNASGLWAVWAKSLTFRMASSIDYAVFVCIFGAENRQPG